jgi:hypothetical protein
MGDEEGERSSSLDERGPALFAVKLL